MLPAVVLAATPHGGDPRELERVHSHLNEELLTAAHDTLAVCRDLENDSNEIETTLQELNFQLLRDTHQHLQSLYDDVHDPTLLEKNRFIDAIEVAAQNLRLLTNPFFEEYAPEDALTESQATRFVIQTYTANDLVRQRAAAQHAHRALDTILRAARNYDSTAPDTSLSEPTPSFTERIREFAKTFIERVFTTPTPADLHPDPGSTADSRAEDADERDSTDTTSSLDERDVVWHGEDGQKRPTPGVDWVDDRDLSERTD